MPSWRWSRRCSMLTTDWEFTREEEWLTESFTTPACSSFLLEEHSGFRLSTPLLSPRKTKNSMFLVKNNSPFLVLCCVYISLRQRVRWRNPNTFRISCILWSKMSKELVEDPLKQTIPFDPRFPNQNQTRNCWQNYVDFHRCQKLKVKLKFSQ